MAGYSGTPLVTKLGIKPGATVYDQCAEGLRRDSGCIARWRRDLHQLRRKAAPVVHLFVTSQAELARDLPKARKAMTIDGALWVGWYKKAAKIPTDVTEDTLRTHAFKIAWSM